MYSLKQKFIVSSMHMQLCIAVIDGILNDFENFVTLHKNVEMCNVKSFNSKIRNVQW